MSAEVSGGAAVDRAGRLLLEREQELARLSALLDQVRAANGRVAVVEGPPGIGKSRLLEEIRATADGYTVLRARGGELERDFPWGVVRQLYEAQVVLCNADRRARLLAGAAATAAEPLGLVGAGVSSVDPTFAALHGLYWLTANLAADSPVLICVDDAQWADLPSLRFLAYLAARVDDLPVAVLTAQRQAAPDASVDLTVDFPSSFRLRLTELSESGVAALVEERFGASSPEFVVACHRAGGGNPFLTTELLAYLADTGLQPSADVAARVGELGPESVARWVLRRLARLPAEAAALAHTVAILGTDAEPRVAASLADLDEQAALAAADALSAAQILQPGRPLEFVHPVVRAAVRDSIPAGERVCLHKNAARVLASTGAGPGRIAVHLLATEPAGDDWVAETLLSAAERSFARGAPDAAAEFLTRALAEPPPTRARAAVLRQLGRATLLGGAGHGVDHYRGALDAATDPAERAAIGRELAFAYVPQGEYEAAVAALEQAMADAHAAGDAVLARLIEADLLTAGRLDPHTLARVQPIADRIDPDQVESTEPGCRLLGSLSLHGIAAGWPMPKVASVARRAAEGGLPADPMTSNSLWDIGFALSVADEFDAADAWWQAVFAVARERGSILTFARCSCFSAVTALRRGDMLAAEAHARAALDAAAGQPWYLRLLSTGMLVESLVERGALTDADAALEAVGGAAQILDVMMLDFLLFARGRLRIAHGDVDAGLADLVEYGNRPGAIFRNNPAVRPWRSHAALVLLGQGRRDEALPLAEAELELARRIESPGAIGVALRVGGLIRGGAEGVSLLEQAVATLEPTLLALEYARALVDLGAELRRSGHRSAARDPLRRGIDLAQRCGARALTDHAMSELHAAGGRPRRLAVTGVEALTASEYRVARMAAEALTNREIAQSLFVTPRTVELHLTHAYAKLGITSRAEIASALNQRGA